MLRRTFRSACPYPLPSFHFDFPPSVLSATGAFPIEPIYKRRLAHNLSQPLTIHFPRSLSPPQPKDLCRPIPARNCSRRSSFLYTQAPTRASTFTHPCLTYQRPEVADALMILIHLIHSFTFCSPLLFLFFVASFYCLFPFWTLGLLCQRLHESKRPPCQLLLVLL